MLTNYFFISETQKLMFKNLNTRLSVCVNTKLFCVFKYSSIEVTVFHGKSQLFPNSWVAFILYWPLIIFFCTTSCSSDVAVEVKTHLSSMSVKWESCWGLLLTGFDASSSADSDMEFIQCKQGWPLTTFCEYHLRPIFMYKHICTYHSDKLKHVIKGLVNSSTFGLIDLPSEIRLCLALAACRPPELLRGLRSLGPPTLDSETLLLTTRQSANKIYETSLCQKCIFKNCIGLV